MTKINGLDSLTTYFFFENNAQYIRFIEILKLKISSHYERTLYLLVFRPKYRFI